MMNSEQPCLRLSTLNHISLNCADVEQSVRFYCQFLGFVEVKRPGSLGFDGAWLFNYGIGIHLLKDERLEPMTGFQKKVNPKADHISFQCEDVETVELLLKQRKVRYLHQVVEEGGVEVEQLFFHDPDGHMIEICNCQLLPVVPLRDSFSYCKLASRINGCKMEEQRKACPDEETSDLSSASES